MKREFNVVIERDAEGYYVASVPELRGCHTQARSLDKLLARATVVLIHAGETLGPGLLNQILKDGEIEREDFEALL